MELKTILIIFKEAFLSALKKINNNKDFHKILSIQYTIEKILKQKKD